MRSLLNQVGTDRRAWRSFTDAKRFAAVASLEATTIAAAPGRLLASPTGWCRTCDLLIEPDSDEAKKLIACRRAPILEQQQKLLAQIKLESRSTPAMQDGSGTDEAVFIRGNPKTPGDSRAAPFPRSARPAPSRSRSRSAAAGWSSPEQMTDPAVTPFITRVYVNRVWHHLFGRGIVGSVDNFGVLGERPTHPELLDYLGRPLRAKDGWSTKKLIRASGADARLPDVVGPGREGRRGRSGQPAACTACACAGSKAKRSAIRS